MAAIDGRKIGFLRQIGENCGRFVELMNGIEESGEWIRCGEVHVRFVGLGHTLIGVDSVENGQRSRNSDKSSGCNMMLFLLCCCGGNVCEDLLVLLFCCVCPPLQRK